MINKRKLGKTDLLVSEIGLGGYQLGGSSTINQIQTSFGDMGEKTAINIINTAMELGINTFDTADFYSLGKSEIRLGQAVKEHRDKVNLFTKAGCVASYSDGAFDIDLSYHHLMASIDRSLKRLGTDFVDVFQIHKAPQSEEDFQSIEKAFSKIKSNGKSRYCGVSVGMNYESGIELMKRGLVDTLQLYFSLIDPIPLNELLPIAKQEGVGIIVAEPLGQGLLTGKYTPDYVFPNSDLRHRVYDSNLLRKKLKKSQEFQFLINENRNASQVALSYVLSRNEVSTCIPGVKSVDQLKLNSLASEIKLSEEELEKIKSIQQKWVE
jgi:aryl-alcohol dehydrogenase-like predicted oxidoreductase|tara:strand:- start:31 stop:999 length:969 start_codon:yes stop_codon:yes gene_type:complete